MVYTSLPIIFTGPFLQIIADLSTPQGADVKLFYR